MANVFVFVLAHVSFYIDLYLYHVYYAYVVPFLLLGSGKTLAFLLPIIEQIHGYNSVYGQSRAPNRPLSVIITPSAELAEQIYVIWFLFCCSIT